ncbi:MAG: hypothetical protein DRN01_03245 [Thermoplasmata archaeon]|nr:MAG: hypothetical protein DRN01_03245 [Thermoplasmata archaeon]
MTSKPEDIYKLHRVLDDAHYEEVEISDKYIESVYERLYGRKGEESNNQSFTTTVAVEETHDERLKPSVEIHGGETSKKEHKKQTKEQVKEEVIAEVTFEEDEELFEVEKISPDEIAALKTKHVEEMKTVAEVETPSEVGEKLKEVKPEAVKERFIDLLAEVKGVGKKKAEILYNQGFTSPKKILEAKPEELTKVKGISRRLAERLKKEAMEIPPKMAAEFDQMYVFDEETSHEKAEVEKQIAEKTVEFKEEIPEWVTLDKAPVDEELPEWKAMEEEGYRYEDYVLYKVEKSTLKGKKKTSYVFSKKPVKDGVPSKLPSGYVVKVKRNRIPVLEKIK